MENKQELQIIETKVGGMNRMVEETKVEDKDQLASVSDKIKDIKKLQKFIKSEMDKTIKPAKEIIDATKDRFNPFLNACIDAEKGLKEKAQVFMVDEQKKENEEREKIAKKVETGYIKPETAVNKMEEVKEAEKTSRTATSTLSMKMLKVPGKIDESKVPEEYWIPKQLDMMKISKVIRAGVEIPGVEIVEKPSMASR